MSHDNMGANRVLRFGYRWDTFFDLAVYRNIMSRRVVTRTATSACQSAFPRPWVCAG